MLSILDSLFPSGCTPAPLVLLVSVLHAGNFPEEPGDPCISAHAQEWGSKKPVVGACQPGTFLQGNLAMPPVV